ncbi:hypothetical protein ABZ864_47475 [Streptomyces sp. NPDC047082]|uniref:hypothetical protein n=1 Tax=Streptomyces sp. NPDC047082 TaxID=3155259 RepID=UPI00340BFE11
MSHDDTASCAGLGCLGLVLLNVWVPVGYLLAAPVTVPALLAAQSPAVRTPFAAPWLLVALALLVAALVTWRAGHRGRVRPWVLLAQSAGLVSLSVVVALWVRSRIEPPALRMAKGDTDGVWTLVSEAQTLAVMLVAVVFFLVVRKVSPAPPPRWAAGMHPVGRRFPSPGEIWLFEQTAKSGERRRRPCLVIDRDEEQARVLWFDWRPSETPGASVAVLDGGWNAGWSGDTRWVNVRRPRDVPLTDCSRMLGHCPFKTWRQVHKAVRATSGGLRHRTPVSYRNSGRRRPLRRPGRAAPRPAMGDGPGPWAPEGAGAAQDPSAYTASQCPGPMADAPVRRIRRRFPWIGRPPGRP